MTLTEQLRRRAEKRVDVPEDVSGKFAPNAGPSNDTPRNP